MRHPFDHRDRRQKAAALWVRGTFGRTTTKERARRLLEEALELAQAEGLEARDAIDLADYVFAKPAGDIRREAGGVGLTLLAYCDSVGLSAEACEALELERVRALPREHFRIRQTAKHEAEVGDLPGTVSVAEELDILNEPPFVEAGAEWPPTPVSGIPPDVLALIEKTIAAIGSREPTTWDTDARAAALAYVRSAGHFTELGQGGAKVAQFAADVADALETRRAKKGETLQ